MATVYWVLGRVRPYDVNVSLLGRVRPYGVNVTLLGRVRPYCCTGYWAGYGPTAVPATGPGTALYPLLGRYGPISLTGPVWPYTGPVWPYTGLQGLYGPILVYRACMAHMTLIINYYS